MGNICVECGNSKIWEIFAYLSFYDRQPGVLNVEIPKYGKYLCIFVYMGNICVECGNSKIWEIFAYLSFYERQTGVLNVGGETSKSSLTKECTLLKGMPRIKKNANNTNTKEFTLLKRMQ